MADTGPLTAAIRSLRNVRGAANSFFTPGQTAAGKLTPSPFKNQLNTFLAPSKGAFALAGNISLAANAMAAFKGQLDQVTRGPIQDFAAFELAMAQVKGKTDNLTQEGFRQLTDSAREMGRTTRFTALEAAEGYGELAASGLGVKQQLGALPPIMKLTTAGGLGLAQTTKIALDTMNQFGLAVGDIPDIADLLVKGFNLSSIGLGELSESLGYVGPIAKAAGLSLKDTVGFTALLGNAGIVGSRAGTALNATLARMANITPRSAKALKQMGIAQEEINGALTDPVAFFKRMNDAMDAKGFDKAKRLSALVRVFGQEAAPAVAEMMAKASNVDVATGKTGFDAIREGMDRAKGANDEFNRSIEETTDHKLKVFDAQMQDLKLTLGASFAPVLIDLNKSMGPVIKDFGAWIKDNPRLVETLGRVTLAGAAFLAVVGPLALAIAATATVWGVLGPVISTCLLPIKLAGKGFEALATRMAASNTAAGAAGAGLVRFVAVTGAAFAGWQVGTMLDEAVGSMLKLRGGKISTELGLSMGESAGMNDLVEGIGMVTGINAIKEVAEGNRQRNAADREKNMPKPPPAEVAVNVKVTDERTIVETPITRPRPESKLRVGSTY